MRVSTLIRRVALVASGAAVLLGATIAGVLAYPQPFFAHRVAEGRLELYSDRPFDANAGRAILADVEARLDRSTLNDRRPHRIFIVNAEWRRRLFFLWGYGAGGINFYPVAGGVFLRQADVEAGRLLKSDGTHVAPPRTLAYYAAHEIGHDFIAERIGAIANWRLPVWIREGHGGLHRLRWRRGHRRTAGGDATRRFRPRSEALRHLRALPAAGGLHARARRLVGGPIAGVGMEQAEASGMTQVEAESRLPRS